ncbi:hypothetical protein F5Y15DRAFT_369357 [Xylariaceae sp. FL0016]|nr:hypothetical protein F5Y15DRAFT_369357 [Xylariaceae sp. FL0016]
MSLHTPRFNASPRTLTPLEQGALKTWFEDAIKNNWIKRSRSRHSCGILFVPKKNGKPRMCINYVPLNAICKSMVYAPRCDRALRSEIHGKALGGAARVHPGMHRTTGHVDEVDDVLNSTWEQWVGRRPHRGH